MEKKVVYRKNGGKRRAGYPLLLLCAVLLFGFSLVNILWPKRSQLELENRKAAQLPAFSVQALLDGSWQSGFARWMQDQFSFRDAAVNAERAVDEVLFRKVEEGGILLGKDRWMFTKLFTVEDATKKQLDKNVQAVSDFAANHPGKVTFLLAPSASVIYPEKLPAGAPMVDENAMLDDIFAKVGQTTAVIDLREDFTNRKDEYLYFKTDHHWTTNGAYRAYEQFCALKGLTPFDRDAHESADVTDFEGTHYSATRLWNVAKDTITYYPLDSLMTVYKITGEAQYEPEKTENLVNADKFATRDKYAAFLDGNNGYSTIEGRGTGSILVVKDSYANSFVPYLTENYAKIGVVDFRNFKYGLDSTIEKEGYDEVLVLYNFQTFIADTNLIYISRPSTL
ncbi:DHHW family protein [uncultured Gemmiger sp.]|uniref:DHHW family protein n=1 Tax=uncultured Gemmiger sp. TaxID=1623490 RepID=UPI0025D8CDC0|nr:DHHW family protein [uncultured Gemmiger sp.]